MNAGKQLLGVGMVGVALAIGGGCGDEKQSAPSAEERVHEQDEALGKLESQDASADEARNAAQDTYDAAQQAIQDEIDAAADAQPGVPSSPPEASEEELSEASEPAEASEASEPTEDGP